MPRQLVNRVELFYEDTGGSGDVILFRHGYTIAQYAADVIGMAVWSWWRRSARVRSPRRPRCEPPWRSSGTTETSRSWFAGAARPELVDEVTVKARAARALSVSRRRYEGSWDAMAGFNVTDRLGELTRPTLMIVGDRCVPRRHRAARLNRYQ